MANKTQTYDITPNWASTAQMLTLILENGTDKDFARKEIHRMGEIIDHLKGKS